MSTYYIQTKDKTPELFSLTCTENIKVNLSGSATENPVSNNTNVADHYVQQNTTMSFSGIISDILNLSFNDKFPQRKAEDSFRRLEELKESGKLFDVYIDGKLYENCLFNSLTFDKSSGFGSAWKVELSMVQLKLVDVTEKLNSVMSDRAKKHHEEIIRKGQSSQKPLDENLPTRFWESLVSLFSDESDD